MRHLLTTCSLVAATVLTQPRPTPGRTVYALEPVTRSVVAYDVELNTASILAGGPGDAGFGAPLLTPTGICLRPDGHLLVLQSENGPRVECLDIDPATGERRLLSALVAVPPFTSSLVVFGSFADGRVLLAADEPVPPSLYASHARSVASLLDPDAGTLEPIDFPATHPGLWLSSASDGTSVYFNDLLDEDLRRWDPENGLRLTEYPWRVCRFVEDPVEFLYPSPPPPGPTPRTLSLEFTAPAIDRDYGGKRFSLHVSTRDIPLGNVGLRLVPPDETTITLQTGGYSYRRHFPTLSQDLPVSQPPGSLVSGTWTLFADLPLGSSPPPPPSPTSPEWKLLRAELRARALGPLAAITAENGWIHAVDIRGRVARIDPETGEEAIVGESAGASPPLGLAAGVVPLGMGDALLVEQGTGRVVRISSTGDPARVVGNILPAGLLPSPGISTGVSVHGLAIDLRRHTESSTFPSVVLDTLDPSQWEAAGSIPGFDSPDFFLDGGLGIGATRANTFGFWQTREELSPLPEGRHRVTVRLRSPAPPPGFRRPEFHVRVLRADNRRAAMGICADTGPNQDSASSIEVEWKSDGVSPWRIAIDVLAVSDDQAGWVVVEGISTRQLGE